MGLINVKSTEPIKDIWGINIHLYLLPLHFTFSLKHHSFIKYINEVHDGIQRESYTMNMGFFVIHGL